MSSLPYSLRNKPEPDSLKYKIPETVRKRIFVNLKTIVEGGFGLAAVQMFEDVVKCCLLQYGDLSGNASSQSDMIQRAARHFLACSDEQAIDFIEWCFRSQSYDGEQLGVVAINNIFREEGIGYELSPYVVTQPVGRYLDVQYPEATKKSNELLHSTTVMPCLHLLSNPEFKTADMEMLQAHEHFRRGDCEAAINACGQAFESVLKTICTAKQWQYDADKATLSALVEICRDKGLFPVFYAEIFKASGTIRNKFGSHGKGPTPPHGVPTAEHAEHMIQQTSAHILLLVRLATA